MSAGHTELLPDDELVTRLDRLIDARRDFVAKRNAMNEAIPAMDATPARRALYDELYKIDHKAGRVLFREALEFAEWAADANPLARHSFGPRAIEAAEADLLGRCLEALREIRLANPMNINGAIESSTWTKIDAILSQEVK